MNYWRRNRRPKKEGTIAAKTGRGEFVTRTDFRAKEVDAVFTDKARPHAACQTPTMDELKITIVEHGHNSSVVRINWNVNSPRKIRFTILG